MKSFIPMLVAITVVVGAVLGLSGHPSVAQEAMIYKNPQCGCCEGYADHLRQNGFKVTVKTTHELSAMSRREGIPDDFQGCHLSYIDGYVVSGHVPVRAVRKLLTERPAIRGITLPGMPQGWF